jgi:hypothetical protein
MSNPNPLPVTSDDPMVKLQQMMEHMTSTFDEMVKKNEAFKIDVKTMLETQLPLPLILPLTLLTGSLTPLRIRKLSARC